MSKTGLSMGMKVMVVPDPSAYPVPPVLTYLGKPWIFVLRDAIQFGKNI